MASYDPSCPNCHRCSRCGGTGPRDEPLTWFTEPHLYELYLTVGQALCTPPQWASEQLKPFIPQPAMDLT